METEITITMQCDNDAKKKIIPLVAACSEYNKDDFLMYSKMLGDDAYEKIKDIDSDFCDYFEGIAISGKKNIVLSITCGSSGEAFLVKMMDLFAPYVDNINGSFEHDEDYEPPVQYILANGSIIRS